MGPRAFREAGGKYGRLVSTQARALTESDGAPLDFDRPERVPRLSVQGRMDDCAAYLRVEKLLDARTRGVGSVGQRVGA